MHLLGRRPVIEGRVIIVEQSYDLSYERNSHQIDLGVLTGLCLRENDEGFAFLSRTSLLYSKVSKTNS